MNKIGIYYAYWTHNWDADFAPLCGKVARLGFDVLEVNSGTVTNMSNAERDRLKEAAKRAEVGLTFCIGLTKEYDVASPDAATRRKGIAFLKRQAQMVHYMEAKELGGIIYGSWPGKLPGGADKREFRDRSVRSMKEVMRTVEDCDVFFNVEVVNRFEQYLLNTAQEAVDYVERVGSGHCGILLDAFHMNIEEDSLCGAIETAGRRLGHFHIGETNRRAPGRGRMPWNEIFSALKAIQYSAVISMEPFLMPGGEVGRDISVYRDLRDGLNLDGEAQRALNFVRAKLRKA